jgi:hypothetical protein
MLDSIDRAKLSDRHGYGERFHNPSSKRNILVTRREIEHASPDPPTFARVRSISTIYA